VQLAVIGGGPAGLRAAEMAAKRGVSVIIFDAMPSLGRKFLVAGKSGLNLTHGESIEAFVARYGGGDRAIWESLLDDFDPRALREWAAALGVETFQASSGRVYPKEMKAAPLLRRWIARLRELGVQIETRHRLVGVKPGRPHEISFSNGMTVNASALVFAMGGGSWSRTGSDGSWLSLFESLGIECRALAPANCGWEHAWSVDLLAKAEGKPLKNIAVSADGSRALGELMVTRYGLEGGAIYQLGAVLRAMKNPSISIDFKPTFSRDELIAKMESVKRDFLDQARVRWKLSDAALAILGRKKWTDATSLADEAKHCIIPLSSPRPLDEAISSAGGLAWGELDEGLMLRRFSGCFVAGEMIDWEAPTGGYLMQGCFATGTRAGNSAAAWLEKNA
jgi:uncharacterized flavoprotein (TIGR03862 family)